MQLIGSIASPFVRRIRILLENTEYDFKVINVFSAEGKEILARHSSLARVPILIKDDGESIWDSTVITNFLIGEDQPIAIQKKLVLINELSDSALQLFQLKAIPKELQDLLPFFENSQKRISEILKYFESEVDLDNWNLVSQWLYCTLDWFDFRSVFSWRKHFPKLVHFHNSQNEREILQKTSPF